jgi:hypothetical protein
VGRPSVELDDQPLRAPEAVDLEPAVGDGEPGVDLGAGEAVLVDESEESGLEVVARDVERRSPSPRISASPIAFATRWRSRTVARSRRVRATVVIKIPSSRATSSGASAEQCQVIRGCGRFERGTIT